MTQRMNLHRFLLLCILFSITGMLLPAEEVVYPDPYKNNSPDYLKIIRYMREFKASAKQMTLSVEKHFFSRALLGKNEDNRANALVKFAIEKETKKQYQEAIEAYRTILKEHPECLYRISAHGVFVPITQYCQRRILNLPKDALEHYRNLADANAKELFEQARKKNSLITLSMIANTMLATSYGDNAIYELGNAALDNGYYRTALEFYLSLEKFFTDSDCSGRELELRIAYCRKKLGKDVTVNPQPDDTPELKRFVQLIAESSPKKINPYQHANPQYISSEDYTLFPPIDDALAIRKPVWKKPMISSMEENTVFSHPVVTNDSVIYRRKNIVFCRSIFNGEIRWKNDMGGRTSWQSGNRPTEERVLVQDGLVFTVIKKGRPSLIAMDEITGRVKWSYGAVSASTSEESAMRFKTAPAGGPATVYAGYVLDNIIGETHTDSEYGIMAFESSTGRIKWRRQLGTLQPGKFTSGAKKKIRNRIRSFSSPPLFHQGTVYYCTNAGVIAALDGFSGRIKWLIRYPYYNGIHDATRGYGSFLPGIGACSGLRPPSCGLWFNQRPLLIGDRLYILPVNSRLMFCIDRRDGKVLWSKPKGIPDSKGRVRNSGLVHFLGQGPSSNHLVFAYSSRHKGIQLVEPDTGKSVWGSPDIILRDTQPVTSYRNYFNRHALGVFNINSRPYSIGARPCMTTDGKIHQTHFSAVNYWWWGCRWGLAFSLSCVDLLKKDVTVKRRYYDGIIVGGAAQYINIYAPKVLKAFSSKNHLTKGDKIQIEELKAVCNDHPPVNRYDPFKPFIRIPFERLGEKFELRFGTDNIRMVYNRERLEKNVTGRNDFQSMFVQAELKILDARYKHGAALLAQSLSGISPEYVYFKDKINQQMYTVQEQLARHAVLSGRPEEELKCCLEMYKSPNTLAQEIHALFALSEAYTRTGSYKQASHCLRNIIAKYSNYEYPISQLLSRDTTQLRDEARRIISSTTNNVSKEYFYPEIQRSSMLMKKGLPLYFSIISPLSRDLTILAGELASRHLIRLKKMSNEYSRFIEKEAENAFGNCSDDEEQRLHLKEFPDTAASGRILSDLYQRLSGQASTHEARKKLWELRDTAQLCRLRLPEKTALFQTPTAEPEPQLPAPSNILKVDDLGNGEWLILQRRGRRKIRPELVFLAARVKKKFDNKFRLVCIDSTTGKIVWHGTEKRGNEEFKEMRLKGKGDEPGFFDAFIYGNHVIVNGLYDVIAFRLDTGKIAWRYRVPFDFEIRHTVMNNAFLIVAGDKESIALYTPTDIPTGEVAWRAVEMGDIYSAPCFFEDKYISLRKMPFNLTVRYRDTGRLIGRLELPDLSLTTPHPIVKGLNEAYPTATNGKYIAVTDNKYYIMINAEKQTIMWKRLIDNNTRREGNPMRFSLSDNYLAVSKKDYDNDAVYLYSTANGRLLWSTNPKDKSTPQAMHSMFFRDSSIYGIIPGPGKGYTITGVDCKTGTIRYAEQNINFNSMPVVDPFPYTFTDKAVLRVQDNQDFFLNVIDLKTGKSLHKKKGSGIGPFKEHGRASAVYQNGRIILLAGDDLDL